MRNTYKYVLAALTLLALTVSAWAYDAAGTWTSSSGAVIQIWCNMQVVKVTIHSKNGRTYKGSGQWTRFGERFTYTVSGFGTAHCAFQGRDQIVVQSPDGKVSVWNRYR